MVARLTSIVIRLSEGCSFEYCHAHFFVFFRSGDAFLLRRVSSRHLYPQCSASNSNNNRLVVYLDPRHKGLLPLVRGCSVRQLPNNNHLVSLAPPKTHRHRPARACLGQLSNSHPRIYLDLIQPGLKEPEQEVACLDLQILSSSSSSNSSNNRNNNHNRVRFLVAPQPLNPARVGTCLEAQPLGLPSRQRVDCLALEG